MKQEIPHWYNPLTGEVQPQLRTMEWDYRRDGSDPLASIEPMPYDPNTENYEVIPQDFLNTFLGERLLAEGKSGFSTPFWDRQKQYQDYLENDRRLRERGLLGGTRKA